MGVHLSHFVNIREKCRTFIPYPPDYLRYIKLCLSQPTGSNIYSLLNHTRQVFQEYLKRAAKREPDMPRLAARILTESEAADAL